MPKPLGPSQSAVDDENAQYIASVAKKIRLLEGAKQGRSDAEQTAIGDEIKTLIEEQLIHLRLMTEHRESSTFGEDEKRYVARHLDEMTKRVLKAIEHVHENPAFDTADLRAAEKARLEREAKHLETLRQGLLQPPPVQKNQQHDIEDLQQRLDEKDRLIEEMNRRFEAQTSPLNREAALSGGSETPALAQPPATNEPAKKGGRA